MDISNLNSPKGGFSTQRISPSKGIMQSLKKSIFSNKNSNDFTKKWSKLNSNIGSKIKNNFLNEEKKKPITIENCFLLSQRKRKWSPKKSKMEKVKSMVARKGYPIIHII
jgi:ribosomal protein S8